MKTQIFLTPRVYDSAHLGWDPIICLSNKFPEDTDAASEGTTAATLRTVASVCLFSACLWRSQSGGKRFKNESPTVGTWAYGIK